MPSVNRQICTVWSDSNKKSLRTELVERPLRAIKSGEVLAEMAYVPLHGSFWLASHPYGLHPRKDEFLKEGSFVFGNGGVGKVIAVGSGVSDVRTGDYLCIFGHVPCDHYDCYACRVLHRYTECDFGESKIIGHGNGAEDGTYGKYVLLPPEAYEICFRADENPTEQELMAFMFGFLVADVRNALTRNMDSLRMRRMLLIGAGYSGLLAAYIHNRTCPESQIFVVDASESHLRDICEVDPLRIKGFQVAPELVGWLNSDSESTKGGEALQVEILKISEGMKAHFRGRKCNLLMDCSSGNSTPLWDNRQILSPTTHCIPYGFGSEGISLDKDLIQLSGLTIMMSRGVGNIRNRKEVIELIKAGAGEFINRQIIANAICLDGLEEAIEFIQEIHSFPKKLHEVEHAYIRF